MPIHVEDMNSDVSIVDGDNGLPLSQDQLERLVELVADRVEERQRAARRMDEASSVRPRIAPSLGIANR